MSEVAQHGSDSMSRMPFVRTEDGFGNLVVSLRAADKVHVLIRRDLQGWRSWIRGMTSCDKGSCQIAWWKGSVALLGQLDLLKGWTNSQPGRLRVDARRVSTGNDRGNHRYRIQRVGNVASYSESESTRCWLNVRLAVMLSEFAPSAYWEDFPFPVGEQQLDHKPPSTLVTCLSTLER